MSEEKRLTMERIEEIRPADSWMSFWRTPVITIELRQLCDLALSALSQEAVRDEALEEGAKVCDETASVLVIALAKMDDGNTPQAQAETHLLGLLAAAKAIRALKREPNAAAQAAGVNDPTVHCPRCGRRMPVSRFATEKCTNKDCAKPYDLPAPAAPDIGTILLQLEGIAKHMRAAYPNLEGDAYWLDQAAEIIAALRRRPERPPSGEMGYEEYHDGIIGVFKTNADGSRNLMVLTPQASEQFRARLSAAEASKEAK